MTSPVDTSVKFFNEKMPGAPSLTKDAGAGIAVLKACLVTGFGSRTATSLVVAGGIATLTLSSNAQNPNLKYSVIEVAGSSITDLNGEQRVTDANSTTLKFATAAADGTASGTITVKTAGAGWEEVYTDTNVSVFRSTDMSSNRRYMRVSDSGSSMRVVGYESMTDASSGTGPFPTSDQAANGIMFMKAAAEGGTGGTGWDLFADKSWITWAPLPWGNYLSTYISQVISAFGDIVSTNPTALFETVNWGLTNSYSLAIGNAGPFGPAGVGYTDAVPYFVRGYQGVGSAVQGRMMAEIGIDGQQSGIDPRLGVGPSLVDNKLRVCGVLIGDYSSSYILLRGSAPGLCYVPHVQVSNAAKRGDILTPATGALAGRKLYCVQPQTSWTAELATLNQARGFVDITGPWR